MHQQPNSHNKPINPQPSTNNLLQKPIKLPTIHDKAAFNEIYVKGSRPLAVYVKHGKKVLQKTNILFIHGMTSTIVKAMKLLQVLRKQFPYLKYEIESDSVPTIIKYQSKDEYEMKQRSCVHIKLQKNFTKQRKQRN